MIFRAAIALSALLLSHFSMAEPQPAAPLASPDASPVLVEPPRPSVGPLPRGEMKVGETAVSKAECPQRFMSVPASEAFFSKQAGKFYLLAKVMKGNRFNLVEVDQANLNGKTLAAFTLKRSSLLLPHGDPPAAVSILSFFEDWEDCGQGKATSITIDFGGDKSVRKTAPLKTYQLLGSDRGPVLGDVASATLWELDPRSGQRRASARLPENERGVFFRPSDRKLWTFREEGEGVLSRYATDPLKKEAELRLKKDSFIIHEGSLFAALMFASDGKEAWLQRFERWSGEEAASDRFTLPADFRFDEARFASHFSSGLLVAFNSRPERGIVWKNAYLIDYNQNKLVSTLTVPSGQYVSEAMVSPDGGTVLFIVKRQADQVVSSVQLWNRTSREFKPVHLMLKP